jgi:hypothetical protein
MHRANLPIEMRYKLWREASSHSKLQRYWMD